jgi:hypothetical protein
MRLGILAAALWALLPLSAEAWAEPNECFDVAVVARLAGQTPEPYPDDPEVIYMSWPWMLHFETEQVLIGHEDRARFRAMMSLHNYFRRDIEHFLVFLRRDPEWGYRVVNVETRVVLDRRGRFIVPSVRPEDLQRSWVPASYEAHLRPVRYRAADAWWLSDRRMLDLDDVPPGWYKRRGDQIVALRGLRLSDLSSIMANEPGARCED